MTGPDRAPGQRGTQGTQGLTQDGAHLFGAKDVDYNPNAVASQRVPGGPQPVPWIPVGTRVLRGTARLQRVPQLAVPSPRFQMTFQSCGRRILGIERVETFELHSCLGLSGLKPANSDARFMSKVASEVDLYCLVVLADPPLAL